MTDVQVVRSAGRAWYDTLLSAGVRIYEWQPTTLHSKTFVVDGEWASIGSMNFDNRSLALNDEATLMVLDPSIGRQMDQVFLDDLRYSEEITLPRFRQRSWLERIAEGPRISSRDCFNYSHAPSRLRSSRYGQLPGRGDRRASP
jgi:cardiolipin synthase